MSDPAIHQALSRLLGPKGSEVGERLIRALAWLAWADGELQPGEAETLERLCDAFEFDDERRVRVKAEIAHPAPLGAILSEITDDAEKRLLLGLAQFLTAVDARQTHEEVVAIANLAGGLGVPGKEAQAVLKAADALAREVAAGVTGTADALAKIIES
ncbi:MAG TPA: TerB family tellurite resistance protein [Myxococcota bacterium]|jgi:uncharacterized membrane protein YebE (DUF533 family)|nr:TerB family tellurite resistance protein [Myxococcota bacterium]